MIQHLIVIPVYSTIRTNFLCLQLSFFCCRRHFLLLSTAQNHSSIPGFVVSTYDKLHLGFVLYIRQALHVIGESLARDDIDDIGGV